MSDSEFSQKPIVFIRHYSFTSRAVTLWIADSILAAIFCKAVGQNPPAGGYAPSGLGEYD